MFPNCILLLKLPELEKLLQHVTEEKGSHQGPQQQADKLWLFGVTDSLANYEIRLMATGKAGTCLRMELPEGPLSVMLRLCGC